MADRFASGELIRLHGLKQKLKGVDPAIPPGKLNGQVCSANETSYSLIPKLSSVFASNWQTSFMPSAAAFPVAAAANRLLPIA